MSDQLPVLDPERDLCGQDDGGSYLGWLRHSMERSWDVVTSYDTDSPTAKQLVLSICDSDCIPGAEVINQCMYIGHFIIHPAEARDKVTGELIDTIRSVWPQPEGPPISFGSKTLIKAVQKLCWSLGRSLPLDPPVKVRLKQRKGGKGHIYYLQLVDE